MSGNGTDGSPVVSVVIPAYKRPEFVKNAVETAIDQDMAKHLYEVIVVDSSPDDQNALIVASIQKHAECTLRFLSKKPEGPGPSRNMGAREARGKYIAFLDSDCKASRSWLREGLNAFDEGVGLVLGKTIPDPAARRGVFTHYVSVEEEGFIYEACNIIYLRDAFEQAGGFPADLTPHSVQPMGGEDLELAWNVKRNGWKSAFAEKAIVCHEVLPLPVWRWLFIKRLFIWPKLVKDYPEVRRFFFGKYFLDHVQAAVLVALAGLLVSWVTPYGLALCVPYLLLRSSEPSQTLRGPLRLFRAFFYFFRDITSFFILLAGSIRFRALLI